MCQYLYNEIITLYRKGAEVTNQLLDFYTSLNMSESTADCWIWKGAVTNNVPLFRYQEKVFKAYNLSYELIIGIIPKGFKLVQQCQTLLCCNPYHYLVVPKLSSESAKQRRKINTIEDFWERIDIKGENECWEWRGGTNDKGYGYFRLGDKVWLAHRLAYTLKVGEIPGKLLLLHSCDNPPCCNFKHLTPGTHQQNMEDAMNKGRLHEASTRAFNFKQQMQQMKEVLQAFGMDEVTERT